MAVNKKPVKIKLTTLFIAQYIIDNINLDSMTVPEWILELNHGDLDPELFENADKLEKEDVIEMFDNALTAVWLFMIVETDTGEISMETNEFEAMRRDYIMTVQQRLDTIYDLSHTPIPGLTIKPFLIFLDKRIEIHISKRKKSKQQELVTRALLYQKKLDDKDKDLPN